jgi:PEP-CTERM motif
MRRHTLIPVLTMAAIMALSVALPARADPIVVSYTRTLVTTSEQDVWILNFSVTNNLVGSSAETSTVYFFGVDVPGTFLNGFRRDETVVPGLAAGWEPYPTTWTNSTFGGSSRVYHLSWIEPIDRSRIRPGQTLDGFLAFPVVVVPPTVNWFAFALTAGTTGSGFGPVAYTGPGAFNSPTSNPGFEGIATEASVAPTPEPTTLVLLGLGLAAAVARGYRDRAYPERYLHR